jgi:hypothetical protein
MRIVSVLRLCAAVSLGGLAGILTGGCPGPDQLYDPVIQPADFVDTIDNPFLPLTPGQTLIYEADTPDGLEHIEVAVTYDTRTILGVACVVVHDTVTLDGQLIEDTFDWYAQDRDGNVWYFGEDSRTYENGVLVSTEGSWEAGVDSAKPGIVMEADPQVGDSYRQEYYVGVAEDTAEVVSLNESVTVPYGSFESCVETKDFTPLEPGVVEYKFYAAGVGQVLTLEGGVRVELIRIETE